MVMTVRSKAMGSGAAMMLALAIPFAPATAQGKSAAPQLKALASEVLGRDVSDSDVSASPDDAVPHAPAQDAAAPEPAPPTAAPDALPVLTLPKLPAPDIAVTDSQLLSSVTDPAGAETVTPATAMPYIVGRSCYTWALKYDPVEGDLLLTEELRLPGPARNWGAEGATEVNPQRSAAITHYHFDAATGTATAGWCVAKDDPMGSYRYTIRQGDREIARFDFTVGDLL
jgi:hypothetical protein